MDNRSNILECAMALFAARGYDAVGIQEIVDAANAAAAESAKIEDSLRNKPMPEC